jgi:phosphorylcholine metabolism protein LicD
MKLILILLILLLIFFCKKKDKKIEYFTPIDALTSVKDKKNIIKLFKQCIKIMEENNIEYWIIGGTLLGSIRDKGLISWDDDTDIAIMKEHINKILLLEDKFKKHNIGIVSWFGGYKLYDLNGTDIKGKDFKFPFVDIFTEIKKDDIYMFESALANERWPLEKYKYDDIFPLKRYEFEDFQVYGPNKGLEMVNKIYPEWQNSALKIYDHTTHVKTKIEYKFKIDYDYTKKPYMWLYWDNINNKNNPAIIDLCYDTVVKYCSNSFEIVRLNKDNIESYIPELEHYKIYMKDLIIAHKVDIYRIMLLYKYGGIYLDSDIIVLRDPVEIMDKLKKYDFVGFGCTGYECKNGYGNPSNWLLASRPNTNLMGNILNKQLEIIKKNKKLDYHDIGKMLIWKELDKLFKQEYEYYHYPNTIDGTRDKDGKWVTTQRLFSNEKIEYDNEENMLFCVYYNSSDLNINKLTKKEILSKDWNITKFIKKSLQI